ncbi:unnamed protein product [Orchesella dallaii]|uniref:Ion transport domain-containing protein n=1 Tax=Orchesella dallaii TaxID=48710 RepID=A0ABP1PPV9_9HEXA
MQYKSSPLVVAPIPNESEYMKGFSSVTAQAEISPAPVNSSAAANIHHNPSQAVELCLRSGAKISTQQHDLSTPIHLACSQGAIEIVKLMFQLQPEEKDTCLKSCDLQRMTPLHCASMFDHNELVEFLVKQGASVNVLDKERRSPLHLAAFRNGWRTMKTLIRLGANISLKDNDNRNVLHAAVIHGGDLDKILDEESCSEFIPILEEKDKNGFTALHYAVKQGHIKNAMKLITLGASIITKNNIGENVMHIACRFGRLNIVQKILKMEQNNSVINEGDGKGLTPLHIASMFGHVRVVQALIKKGALLHRDHNGNTPAHLAAKNGHRETMKLILNVHSHLLDQTDKDGNTPIHIASMENQPDAVDLLLTLNCNLTYNYKGFSAIDFALQNKFSAVALAMVTHRTRGNEILAMSSGKYPSIMLALVATMPQVVAAVLDRCIIKSDEKSDSEHYNIKYDFKWLSLVEPEGEQRSIQHKTGEKVEEKFRRHSFDRKHLPILNGMVYHGRVELLSHDLSHKYLQMKWNAYGKYIHFSHLILYLCYLGILTSFASGYLKRDRAGGGIGNIIHGPNTTPQPGPTPNIVDYLTRSRTEAPLLEIDLPGIVPNMSRPPSTSGNKANHIHSTQQPSTKSSTSSSINDSWNAVGKDDNEYGRLADGMDERSGGHTAHDGTNQTYSYREYVKAVIIFVVALINMMRECTIFYRPKLKYILDTVNWVYWAMNIACLFMIGAKFIPGLNTYTDPSASLATFFSWFYLLLFLQRFDVVGIYVVMFLEILHTLLRVLMIFSILIVAFGLAFYILLSDGQHKAFTAIPIALLRTFSMMLGEVDFLNTFVNPHFCGDIENEAEPGMSYENSNSFICNGAHICKGGDERKLPHPISSFLMLGIFMVFMPILLMNLLIGLAVGDIESVRRNAQLKRLAMQVHLHTHLEKNLPKFILQRVDKNEVIEYPNARKARLGMIDQFFKYFQPKSSSKAVDGEEENVSNDVMLALHQSNETLANVAAHLENLETLMRLLCHKMELPTDADFIDEGTQVDDTNPMSDMKTRFQRGVTVRMTRRPPKPQRYDSTA